MKQLFEVVEYGKERYWVSLVKWGFIRRKIYSIIKPRRKRFEYPSFVPMCEIAVFTASPRSGKHPFVNIYLSTLEGEKAFYKITSAIKNKGMDGATDYVVDIKFSDYKEFGKINPNS